jgi:hypothetical protein
LEAEPFGLNGGSHAVGQQRPRLQYRNPPITNLMPAQNLPILLKKAVFPAQSLHRD